MNLTHPSNLRAQLQKQWDRGDFLAALALGEERFPLRLPLRGPTSSELSEQFPAVRAWISELLAMPHCRLETREVRHRVFGANALPIAAWIDRLENVGAILGKNRDIARFRDLLDITSTGQPALVPWVAKRALRVLEHHAQWRLLLDIVGWLQAHPRPGIYLRQIDLPGLHTKFFEAHRGLLTEMLDVALSPDAIDANASGLSQFAARYGFLEKPQRVRFRMLSPSCAVLPGASALQDVTADSATFAALNPDVHTVFITENEINFLSFPEAPASMVIFGGGYGFENLRQAQWLARCRVLYWGDIDTHGFAILDQIRVHMPHAESLLMDRETLMTFESQWGMDERQTIRDLTRLTAAELDLYNDLRDNRIREKLRLEQERIGFGWVVEAIGRYSR